MSFVDRLKAILSGKKSRPQPGLYAALEKQLDGLEAKLQITDQVKRIEGGLEGFDLAYEEARQTLASYTGEGRRQDVLDLLLKRMELSRAAAHLLREEEPDRKRQSCLKFLADFKELKGQLPQRTKTKYERIRIDFQSGRLR